LADFVTFDAQGEQQRGYLALPQSGSGPGVLVMHAWWGLTDFFTGLADNLASEGFVVLAPDLYNGVSTDEISEAEKLVKDVDSRSEWAIKVEEAAADYLLSNPAVRGKRLGVVGFSMGADYSSWLASQRGEVAAVVLFYGGTWIVQQEGYTSRTNAAFLGHFAEADEFEPIDAARSAESTLQSGGKEVTFHYYPGAKHWFFEKNRPNDYNPDQAQAAWQSTVEFLHRHLDNQ
jgi:carboxymethylenebutenolidase